MIIDGTDIRTLGMFILRGGSNDFLSFPERREPDMNDWAEHDGLEVDFSDLAFCAKKISVHLYISAPDTATFNQRLSNFQVLNNQPGYREIFVKEFKRTFSLRYLGCSNYEHRGGLVKQGKKSGKIIAEYKMDKPMQLFSAPQPPVGIGAPTHVFLNGIDMAKYGIIVEEVYSTALNPGMLKSTLERSFNHLSGITADVGAAPKRQAKLVTIYCVMTAGSLDDFYTNYNALFGVMNSQTAIELSTFSSDYTCYYKSMSGFTKYGAFDKKIRVSFQLNLQITL